MNLFSKLETDIYSNNTLSAAKNQIQKKEEDSPLKDRNFSNSLRRQFSLID